MDNTTEIARMRRQLRILQVGVVGGVAAVAAALLLQSQPAGAADGKATFTQLEVQRIDVVDPDGTKRLVLSNKPKSPAPTLDGIELAPGGNRPGMIFYNGEGDESGGLVNDSQVVDGKQQAYGLLTFDQYKQDQTLVLQYFQDGSTRGVGFRVQDRPETPLSQIWPEYQAILAMKPGPEKDKALAAFEKKYPNPQRVFVGKSTDKASVVTLADGQGRPRLVLRVAENGSPQLQFLDAKGKVTKTITG